LTRREQSEPREPKHELAHWESFVRKRNKEIGWLQGFPDMGDLLGNN